MLRIDLIALALAGAMLAAPAAFGDKTAESANGGDGAPDTRLLENVYPGVDTDEIRPAQAPGLWEVNQGTAYGYITGDGRYMIQGDLIDLKSGESLTEARRNEARRELIDMVGADKTIAYPPDGGTEHVVYVFTDISCGYCRKLHRELGDYHAQGIELRYLFYPRSGPGSASFKEAESVWCADDRQAALTRAKAGGNVAPRQCKTPVMDHYLAGQQAGLRGTPMMVLADGTSINGYVPAASLAQRLDARSQ